jgi:hypothetical protein
MTDRGMGPPGIEAELVCFLTLSEIFAFRSEGEWLRIDHLVESTRIWLRRHNRFADWRVRVRLSRTAVDLAHQLVDTDNPAVTRAEVRRYFTREMEINFASPRVVAVYAQCVVRMAQRR